MLRGKLFQSLGAAAWKLFSPVVVRVLGMASSLVSVDDRRYLLGLTTHIRPKFTLCGIPNGAF